MNGWMNAAAMPTHRVHCCFYGPTGSGKTAIAASFPRPIFIIPQNEGSEETLRGLPIPVKKVNTSTEMVNTLHELLALHKSGHLHEWGETIIIESLSHYSELFEMELTNRGAGTMQGKWGQYNSHFVFMREVLWQLDAHVVFTGLPMVKTDKNGSVIKAGVKLYGQPGELLVSSCEVVGYCEQIAGNQFLCHVENYGGYPARTRIRGMPNATYQNFNFGEHIAPYLQQSAPLQQ